MPENTDFQTKLEKLRPAIERLVSQADDPTTVITGFILSTDPRSMIRFGNVGNQGSNLVRLHLALAMWAAEMYPNNPYPDIPFADVGPRDTSVKEDALALADELAQAVIISGMEHTHTDKIIDLARRYAVARKAEGGK